MFAIGSGDSTPGWMTPAVHTTSAAGSVLLTYRPSA
jgi:hypothetical protein